MCIFPKRFLTLSNYRSALFLYFMEKVKWNRHFFQFTVPEKKTKKKNAKVKFVGNGNQSEEKIDAEPQSLKARLSCDGPDKISSKYVAKASRVRHTIIISLLNHINYSNVPFYHRETFVRV